MNNKVKLVKLWASKFPFNSEVVYDDALCHSKSMDMPFEEAKEYPIRVVVMTEEDYKKLINEV